MKRKALTACFVLCLLGFACVAQAQATDAQTTDQESTDVQEPKPFRVMTFNIRYGGAMDPPSVWSDRRERVLSTIQAFDPDLLCVQEATLMQVRYLRDEMEGYVFFGAGRDNGKLAGEMCAIYYRSERFLRIGGGHFWLSEEPDEPGSYGWDAAFPRMVSWLRLRDKIDHSVLMIANTHFDHQGEEARLNSAKMIRQHLPELAEGVPIVLVGDFNCDEDSPPYAALLAPEEDGSAWLLDAYRLVHPQRSDQELTFHAFRGETEGSRIDWVLTSPGIEALEAGIDRTHEGLKYPSDHYPVTAVLRQKRP